MKIIKTIAIFLLFEYTICNRVARSLFGIGDQAETCAQLFYVKERFYGFSIAKCTETPYDQHYDENNFYNKKGYREVMENFNREKKYYKDSLIVKHHKMKYSSKMPLWN